jgi:uncharacterized protein (TIGR02145 family)
MKTALTILIGVILFFGCKKDNINNPTSLVPTSPENLTGMSITSGTVNLSWVDRSTNETGFKIERKLAGGAFSIIGTTVSDVSTFKDSGLTPSTTYIYRVYSFNSAGNSTTYSNEFSLFTSIPTITIGTQEWTTQNLDVSTYTDGTLIPQVTDSSAWVNLTTGAWCYYKNNTANGVIYGKLYNWYAIVGIWNNASSTNVSLRKKITPNGYHMPSNDEWNVLINYLGGEGQAGGKSKETGLTHWTTPNLSATNSSGFTALPGGARNRDGIFEYIADKCTFWTINEVSLSFPNNQMVFIKSLDYNSGNFVAGYADYKRSGYSVRILKD